jgi:hypothetical protein
MTIQALGRMENIIASLEKYVQDNLVTTDSVAVGFPGVPFEPRSKDSWAELTYLKQAHKSVFRRVDATNRGGDASLLIQFLCFARRRTSTGATVHRAACARIRDKILGRFQLGREIDVKDYAASGTTVVDNLCVVRVENEPLTVGQHIMASIEGGSGSAQGLDAWAITIELQYVEPTGATA